MVKPVVEYGGFDGYSVGNEVVAKLVYGVGWYYADWLE